MCVCKDEGVSAAVALCSYFEIWVWKPSILVRVLVSSSNTFSCWTETKLNFTSEIKLKWRQCTTSWGLSSYWPVQPRRSCCRLLFWGFAVAPTWTPAREELWIYIYTKYLQWSSLYKINLTDRVELLLQGLDLRLHLLQETLHSLVDADGTTGRAWRKTRRKHPHTWCT